MKTRRNSDAKPMLTSTRWVLRAKEVAGEGSLLSFVDLLCLRTGRFLVAVAESVDLDLVLSPFFSNRLPPKSGG